MLVPEVQVAYPHLALTVKCKDLVSNIIGRSLGFNVHSLQIMRDQRP